MVLDPESTVCCNVIQCFLLVSQVNVKLLSCQHTTISFRFIALDACKCGINVILLAQRFFFYFLLGQLVTLILPVRTRYGYMKNDCEFLYCPLGCSLPCELCYLQ